MMEDGTIAEPEIRVRWMEIDSDELTLVGFFEGPAAEIGDAVEMICTERSPGKMTLQLRVKKD